MMNYLFKLFYKLRLTSFINFLDKRFNFKSEFSQDTKKTIVFCGPATPWGILHQRPQNFAKALSKSGFHVIYCIDPYNIKLEIDSNTFGYKAICDSLELLSAPGNWHEKIDSVDYIYTCYPWHLEQLNKIKNRFKSAIHVHDIFDDIEIFSTDGKDAEKYKKLVNISDKCLYSADKIKPKRLDCIYTPNGCDVVHFHTSNKIGTAGYVGAIDTWFDFNIVNYMAKKLPYVTFYLAGICNNKVKYKLDNLLCENNNIIYLGKLNYNKVPNLVRNFDYALIPFLINDITLSTSPIKMFEYLASGTDVISTRLPEVEKYADSVFIIDNALEGVQIISEKLTKDKNLKAKVVERSSWESRLKNVFE